MDDENILYYLFRKYSLLKFYKEVVEQKPFEHKL